MTLMTHAAARAARERAGCWKSFDTRQNARELLRTNLQLSMGEAAHRISACGVLQVRCRTCASIS